MGILYINIFFSLIYLIENEFTDYLYELLRQLLVRSINFAS